MVRSHAGRGALLSANLPQLQNLIKRDPQGYKDEFLQQWNHYQSTRKIFAMSPDGQSSSAQSFREMVTFISQVCAFKGAALPKLIESSGLSMLPRRD